MNKLTLLLTALFFVCMSSFAQTSTEEGYINDPDGYTNLRDGRSSSSNILTTVKTAELFHFESSDQSNWWSITKNDGTTGYVHSSRIVSVPSTTDEISKLINNIRTTNPNNVEFGEESNEQLFLYAEKFPKCFVTAFENAREDSQQLIIEELESPIHDMIDLPLVYQRINSVKESTGSKGKILEAIKIAGRNLNIDVTN